MLIIFVNELYWINTCELRDSSSLPLFFEGRNRPREKSRESGISFVFPTKLVWFRVTFALRLLNLYQQGQA